MNGPCFHYSIFPNWLLDMNRYVQKGPASEGFISPEKRLANCVTVTSMCAQGSSNTVP